MDRHYKKARDQRAKLMEQIDFIDKSVSQNVADMVAFTKGADEAYDQALKDFQINTARNQSHTY